jgi:hypothetical protein
MLNEFVQLYMSGVNNTVGAKVFVNGLRKSIKTKDRQLQVSKEAMINIAEFFNHGYSICCDKPIVTFVIFQMYPNYHPGAMLCKDCTTDILFQLSHSFRYTESYYSTNIKCSTNVLEHKPGYEPPSYPQHILVNMI